MLITVSRACSYIYFMNMYRLLSSVLMLIYLGRDVQIFPPNQIVKNPALHENETKMSK